MIRPFTMATLATGLVLAVGAVQAQAPAPAGATPEAQVEHRKQSMKRMADASKRIAAYVRGEGGSLEEAQAAAVTIHEVAPLVPELFPEGTGVGVGKSEALPVIWQRWDEFQMLARSLNDASARLVEAAQSGDRRQIAAQFAATGKVCGNCHDSFKQPD